jgi:UPF0755 protein
MLNRLWFWLLMASLLVIGLGTYGAARQVQVWLYQPLPLTQPVIVSIAPGSGLSGVSKKLFAAGVIAHAESFKYYAKWRQLDRHIKAGEYQFSGALNSVEVLAQLVTGKVLEYQFTVPEGLTYKDFIDLLVQHPAMLDKSVPETSDWMTLLHSRWSHPEGLLFPSTYRFARHNEPIDIIRQAYMQQQEILQQAWAQRAPDLPYKTPYEALIMASIIEKETGQASERNTIAGVFVRRLQKGMKLQTDPTVIYGMGEAFDGNIRRKDLTQDTPYNTYVHKGLPPTPIALPGKAAIEAALHPAGGLSLFFVAKGDGSHVFAQTYPEHQANVRKYQLKQ